VHWKVKKSAETSHAVVNLQLPPFKFVRYNNRLHQSLKDVSEESMENAADEAT
jgi:hypothetical protein